MPPLAARLAPLLGLLVVAACGDGPGTTAVGGGPGIGRGEGNDPGVAPDRGTASDPGGSNDPGVTSDPIGGSSNRRRPRACDPQQDDCGSNSRCSVSASSVGVCVDLCALPSSERFGPSPDCAPKASCFVAFQGVTGTCVYPCTADADCPVVPGDPASCVEIIDGGLARTICAWGLASRGD